MAERKATTTEKRTLGYKIADPEKASIDLATQEMIARAQALGIDRAGGLGNDICDLPAAGSAPEWMSEKAISIDKARDRILVDMASRRELAAV